MSTPRAKRALNMGSTPAGKRAKRATTVFRGTKTETKWIFTSLTHTSTSASNTLLTSIPQGANQSERIGLKVKALRIEAVLTSQVPLKVTFYTPYDADDTATMTNDTLVPDPTKFVTLGSYVFNNHAASQSQIMTINHKLPLGVVCRWDSTTGTSTAKNPIYAQVSSVGNVTVTGQFRVWYIDY